MAKPPSKDGPIAGVSVPRKPSKLLGKLQEISSFLTDVSYPDGSAIGNVQLTVRTRGPLVLAQLKLASLGGLRLSVEDACVDDALVALEGLLLTEPVPWEPDPYPLDSHAKKKK